MGLSGCFRSPCIPLGIGVENKGSRNRWLGFAIGADYGRFFAERCQLISGLGCVLVRVGWFLPCGPAEAAVMVSEGGACFGSGVNAGAYASTNGTSMAHFYGLAVGVAVSERLGPSTLSRRCLYAEAGYAPMRLSLTVPFSNSILVGMLRISYFIASC